ncbi:MAG: NAD(+) kinase [Opitutae bacterium]|nr:NAD(+) kinase [Opitutae bacterium]
MKPLKKIAIVANASKPGAAQLAEEIQAIAEQHEVSFKKTSIFPCESDFLAEMDACFVVGGDGTLLGMMKSSVEHNVPVAGIRHGKLGFLATLSPDELHSTIPELFLGNYRIKQRSMIKYTGGGGDANLALNDLVVKSGSNSRLARFSVHLNEEHVADYACDGIVFSTPTGSTAYNLAAGGPIVHPDAQVVLMTPISAHSLTSRSMVFPSGVLLKISPIESNDQPLVSADGQPAFSEMQDFPVCVSLANEKFSLMELADHSHFRVLRNKLKWG